MTYPTLEELIQAPNKSHLFEIRPAYRSMLKLIFGFFWSIIIAYSIVILKNSYADSPIGATLDLIPTRILTLAPIGFLIEIVRRRHNDLYVLAMHRITHYRGRLSFNYHVPVIKYGDIRAINVEQNFIGRILNYGDVELGTAAHDGNELTISGAIDPSRLALLMDQLRTNSMAAVNNDKDPQVKNLSVD